MRISTGSIFFAADFKDRIVHHILVDYLERIWEPVFIHDSYACRKGKGVHKGVLRLQQFIRKATSNGIRPAYYIQLDIRNYFMSIDKEILFSLIARKTKDDAALWLARVLIFHNCDEAILDKLTATISSYLGHFKMANTYSLCCALWARYPFLKQYYQFDPGKQKLVRKYKYPKGFRKARQQYCYYRWMFPGDVLLFQVGRFYEFYHENDEKTASIILLKQMKENKRGARYGFPITMLNAYFRMLLRERLSVTMITEREQYWTRIKERLPRYRFEYM